MELTKEQVEAIKNDNEALKTSVSEKDTTINTLNDEVEGLKTENETLKTDSAKKDDDVEALKNEVYEKYATINKM